MPSSVPDSNDRIDRQFEFLTANQAQLSSDLAELRLVVAAHSRQLEKHEKLIAKQGEQIAMHSEQIAAQGGQVQSLADSMLRLARIVDERDRQTDAKINSLIAVVERYFSNGKKEPS